MRKQIFVIKTLWLKTLFLMTYVLSQPSIADTAVINTPVEQSFYETPHQGRIQVNAILFNAPCNLSFKKNLSLTGCGAGNNYREMNLFDATANTPVTLQFYDVQQGISSRSYSLSLLNGSNPIHLPFFLKNHRTLRLEVNYE